MMKAMSLVNNTGMSAVSSSSNTSDDHESLGGDHD
jgi:hypothetical protein